MSFVILLYSQLAAINALRMYRMADKKLIVFSTKTLYLKTLLNLIRLLELMTLLRVLILSILFHLI